jgi:gas vesicle protein
MKKAFVALFAGVLIGAFAAAQAKLPPAPAKSDAEKKVEADKAAASKAKDDADLAKAQDRAVANYKRSHSGTQAKQK